MYDVVIVGAGYAGIAAAKSLKEKGIENILILEKNNYIGGRSSVFKLNDKIIGPSGQEFISPSYKNLWELANFYNLSLKQISVSNLLFCNPFPDVHGGQPISIEPEKLLLFFTLSSTISAKDKLKMVFNAPRLLRQSKITKSNGKTLFNYLQSIIGYTNTELFVDTIIRTTWGHSASVADANYFIRWFKNTMHGKVFTIEGGINQILISIMKDIGSEKCVMDSEVTLIKKHPHEDSVDIIYHDKKEKHSKHLQAKYVIVTSPTVQAKKFIKHPHPALGLILEHTEYSINQRIFCRTIENFDYSYIYVPARLNQSIQGLSYIPPIEAHEPGWDYFSISMNDKEMLSLLNNGSSTNVIHHKLNELNISSINGFPKTFEVLGGAYWQPSLPVYSPKHIKNIQYYNTSFESVKHERILLAGDMIGGPYSEGAYQSGVDLASIINL